VKQPKRKINELGCFFPNVSVVQTTNPGQRNHSVIIRFFRLNRATYGWIFVKMVMSQIMVIISDVLLQQPVQVVLIENNHMIEHLPATTSNPTLSNAIPPTPRRFDQTWIFTDLFRFTFWS
jgi:hypothetical protein